MSVEIAWKQNILVTDFHLLKSLLVVTILGDFFFKLQWVSQFFLDSQSKANLGFTTHNHRYIDRYVIYRNFMDLPIILGIKEKSWNPPYISHLGL